MDRLLYMWCTEATAAATETHQQLQLLPGFLIAASAPNVLPHAVPQLTRIDHPAAGSPIYALASCYRSAGRAVEAVQHFTSLFELTVETQVGMSNCHVWRKTSMQPVVGGMQLRMQVLPLPHPNLHSSPPSPQTRTHTIPAPSPSLPPCCGVFLRALTARTLWVLPASCTSCMTRRGHCRRQRVMRAWRWRPCRAC